MAYKCYYNEQYMPSLINKLERYDKNIYGIDVE